MVIGMGSDDESDEEEEDMLDTDDEHLICRTLYSH